MENGLNKTDKMELLKNYTNEQNALIVENYPYGYLRTSIKYWIETNKKGDRFISCTLNPKTNKWNNPKKSVYYSVAVMIKEDNGYISYLNLYPTTDKEDINNFLEKTKGFEFNKEQINQLNILRAYSKVYEKVKYEVVTKKFRNKETGEITEIINPLEINKYEIINPVNEEEQKQIQQEIKNQVHKEYLNLREI